MGYGTIAFCFICRIYTLENDYVYNHLSDTLRGLWDSAFDRIL